MIVYNIKTPKNKNGHWKFIDKKVNIKIDQYLSKKDVELMYAILIMKFEQYYIKPIKAEFCKYGVRIHTKNDFYIISHENYILDGNILYKINDDEERKKLERSIKLKKIL
jgi:hypothetical protein